MKLITYYNPKLQIENKSLTQAKILTFGYMYGAKSGYTVAAQRALFSYAGNEDLSYILITTGAKQVQILLRWWKMMLLKFITPQLSYQRPESN